VEPHTRQPQTARDAHHTLAHKYDDGAEEHAVKAAPLNRTALSATIHCLTGCAIGEVAGMVIGTALGWGNAATIAVAMGLAFATGYAFTIFPLLRAGLPVKRALGLALAADTMSVTIMEIVDNLIMLAIPGAMNARLSEALFWSSLVASLVIAGVAAYAANRWLIARGKGHALVHSHQRAF